MVLLDAPIGQTLRIAAIQGGKGVEGKLRQLGLLPGDVLRVTRCAPLGGPLLVEVQGRMIALGRGVASQVVIEEIECVSR